VLEVEWSWLGISDLGAMGRPYDLDLKLKRKAVAVHLD
jgi:hypothetical protein